MNLNKLAEVIVKKEGLKKNLSIAQVKEVLRITLRILKKMSLIELADLFKRVKK